MTLQDLGERAAGSAASRFTYDVFVVHAEAAADEAFVNGYLLAKLGLAPERVLRLQTLELGQVVTEEIERGVRSSRVTIVVLSSAYMDDYWAAFGEQLAAYASVAKDVHGVLLPLLLEDCKLTMYVQSLVKLDFRDPSRALWDAEIDRLRAYLDRPAAVGADLPCPYPGMRPFTEDDAGRFFGREIDNIVYRLRHGEREIYVIGPSGSGKSSLIAAGLEPRLTKGVEGLPRFCARTFRPGERPLERLVAALEGDVATFATTVEQLLVRHPPATSLLLVIDQLEELFATAGDDQRRDFLAALRGLRADPRCVLVFTLRADFYGAFMTSSLWADNDGRISRIDLGPPGSDSLRVVIERPARSGRLCSARVGVTTARRCGPRARCASALAGDAVSALGQAPGAPARPRRLPGPEQWCADGARVRRRETRRFCARPADARGEGDGVPDLAPLGQLRGRPRRHAPVATT